jgi:hypothetical protein
MKAEFFIPPISAALFEDCISKAVHFRFDKMEDDSWRRVVSDITPETAFTLLEDITSCTLRVCEHQFDEDNIRWRNNRHLELIFELRKNSATYIFSAELEYQYLDYLKGKYQL